MTGQGLSAPQAAAAHGVTPSTARKWLGRYLAGGESALTDASSRPAPSPRAIEPAKALLIVELRRRRLLQVQIARSVGVSESTVSRVLACAGLSKLSDLQPVEPVHRYEHDAPGDLLYIDTKKLGRIERPSHRVTGNRRDSVDGSSGAVAHFAGLGVSIKRVLAKSEKKSGGSLRGSHRSPVRPHTHLRTFPL